MMILTTLLSVILGSSLSLAAPQLYLRTGVEAAARPRRVCGTDISAAEVVSAERLFRTSRLPPTDPNAKAEIDIHFHIIAANQTIQGGWVPDSQIKDQIDVLNEDYASTGVSWTLRNVTRIISAEWFNNVGPDSPENSAMKQVFRVGDATTLNVYTVGFVTNPQAKDLLGYSTFPVDYKNAPKDDGVVVRYSTLPGGNIQTFNKGRTLTHEVGHWVGLYHTFQGGCTGKGDHVEDTAPEASPASGCPASRSTCPGGQQDPVHNFMDYTDDSCMTGFTPGQAARMKNQIRFFRGIEPK